MNSNDQLLGTSAHHNHYHFSPKKTSKIQCRYWVKFGSCKRGDRCRFRHDNVVSVKPPQQTSPSNPSKTHWNQAVGDTMSYDSTDSDEDLLDPMWRRLMGRMIKLDKYQYECTNWNNGGCQLGEKCKEHTQYMAWLKNKLFTEKKKQKSAMRSVGAWSSPKSPWKRKEELTMPAMPRVSLLLLDADKWVWLLFVSFYHFFCSNSQ